MEDHELDFATLVELAPRLQPAELLVQRDRVARVQMECLDALCSRPAHGVCHQPLAHASTAVLREHEHAGQPRREIEPRGHVVLDQHRRPDRFAFADCDERSRDPIAMDALREPVPPALVGALGIVMTPLVPVPARDEIEPVGMIGDGLDLDRVRSGQADPPGLRNGWPSVPVPKTTVRVAPG